MRAKPGDCPRFVEKALVYEGDGCLIWPYSTVDGYGHAKLEGKIQYVSRYICEKIHGPAPSTQHVAAHSCGKGDKGCVTKSHIRWKTHSENKLEQSDHGPLVTRRLLEDKYEEIKQKYATGRYSYTSLAKEYGISGSTMRLIILFY